MSEHHEGGFGTCQMSYMCFPRADRSRVGRKNDESHFLLKTMRMKWWVRSPGAEAHLRWPIPVPSLTSDTISLTWKSPQRQQLVRLNSNIDSHPCVSSRDMGHSPWRNRLSLGYPLPGSIWLQSHHEWSPMTKTSLSFLIPLPYRANLSSMGPKILSDNYCLFCKLYGAFLWMMLIWKLRRGEPQKGGAL